MSSYKGTVIIQILLVHVGGSKPESRKFLRLNSRQTSLLEESFAAHNYPSSTTLAKLALQTGLQRLQIIRWFGNKRQTAGEGKCGKYILLF